MNAQKLVDYVNNEGGVCILAHPFRKNHSYRDLIKLKGLSGIEVYNRKNSLEEIEKSLALANEMKLPFSGGSDSHIAQTIGTHYTIFQKNIDNVDELVKEIKRGNFYGITK